jgi:hypothetical protein
MGCLRPAVEDQRNDTNYGRPTLKQRFKKTLAIISTEDLVASSHQLGHSSFIIAALLNLVVYFGVP